MIANLCVQGSVTRNQAPKSARPDCRGPSSTSFLVKRTKSPLLAHNMGVTATTLMKCNKQGCPSPPTPTPSLGHCALTLPAISVIPYAQASWPVIPGTRPNHPTEPSLLGLPCPPVSTPVPAALCLPCSSCGQARSCQYISPHCSLQTRKPRPTMAPSREDRVQTHLTRKPTFSTPAGHLAPGPAVLRCSPPSDLPGGPVKAQIPGLAVSDPVGLWGWVHSVHS